MALVEAKPALITTSVFENGNLAVEPITVETNSSASPPKPLLIMSPSIQGTYPVLLFLHGTCLRNTYYTQLLQQISSHGNIVVAPQLYVVSLFCSGTEEIKLAAEVTNWLSPGLETVLPENVRPDLLKLALAGHSRGGKAAFALALGHAETFLRFSALLGIDPVAGTSIYCQLAPKILTYVPRSFNLDIPVTVIGTGLGSQQKNCLMPPCAPNGVNHAEFFTECKPPNCYYFLAKHYGHMDMLDDAVAAKGGCLCKSGDNCKDKMRKCVGGLVVAFLNAYLGSDFDALKAIVGDPAIAPIELDPVIFEP
uniref:Putative chlorophyllase-1 n=2 Tax=Davidia involucrata TaxID=16924 RepID=A0A5B6ZEE5_DAVIN